METGLQRIFVKEKRRKRDCATGAVRPRCKTGRSDTMSARPRGVPERGLRGRGSELGGRGQAFVSRPCWAPTVHKPSGKSVTLAQRQSADHTPQTEFCMEKGCERLSSTSFTLLPPIQVQQSLFIRSVRFPGFPRWEVLNRAPF